LPTAPITEQGVSNPNASLAIPGWRSLRSGVVDDIERTEALKWPRSVRETYPEMRNDSQVEALYYATTLPIRRYRWVIDPNGARDGLVEKASRDYRLPVKGTDGGPIPRYDGRFSFDEHLRLVLLSLLFGHYVFEQVMPVGDDGFHHVHKLAPRPPHVIQDFQVSQDGGLESITLTIGRDGKRPEPIAIDRLLAYVWDQEPGRWTGRSMLRSIYREWLAKDRLIRVDQVKHERNGMGVPTPHATSADVTPAQLQAAQQIAQAWMVGEHASATMPFGVEMRLLGVQGTLPDTLASIQRHDEAMSRRWLGMLIQLGQTETGSRALGGEFADLIEMGRDAIADWVCDVFSQHQLQDDADWNYEPREEFCPRLAYEKPDDAQVVQAPPAVPIGAPAVPVATANGHRPKLYGRVRAALAEPSVLRRERLPQELRAATDFEAIDVEWRDALTRLLSAWEDVTATEIAEITAQVQAATSLEQLANVQTTAHGADVLAGAMREAAAEGMRRALGEAGAQGVQADEPDLGPVEGVLEQRARAIATLLARSLSEAAGREAVRLAGGATGNEDIATGVRTHLEGLSTSYLEDRLGGAVTAAQGEGRKAAFEAAEQAAGAGASYYASEILDGSTCENCAAIDGEPLEDLDAVRAEYPAGGFVGCLGADRCRGTAVQVFEEG
jgi:hypothetical protein